jgi:23S rRNA pseudouridine2457 synthase
MIDAGNNSVHCFMQEQVHRHVQEQAYRYFIVNKPYDMVSQFVSSHAVRVLGELGFDFPEGTHPIGRLDNDSEGLLILTTDKRITRLLFQGEVPHRRTYLVKVKYAVSEENIARLRQGVTIRIRGGGYYVTAPCVAELVDEPDGLFSRGEGTGAAAGSRAGPTATSEATATAASTHYTPVSWLRLTLTEGKFHQVRKMVAAIGHRCIRLVRVSIEELTLTGMAAGEVREVAPAIFFEQLKIPQPGSPPGSRPGPPRGPDTTSP